MHACILFFLAWRSAVAVAVLELLVCTPASAHPLQLAHTTLKVSMTVLASCEGRASPTTGDQGAVVCPPDFPFRAHWAYVSWRAGTDSTAQLGPVFSGTQQLGGALGAAYGAAENNAVAVLNIAYSTVLRALAPQ
jgi:hypothetical protein